MKEKIFKSNIASVAVLSLIMLSTFIYIFLQYEMKSADNTQWKIIFPIRAIILFFIGTAVYTIAILLDMNISNNIFQFNPNGLKNPIFTALSTLPLCIILIFLILNDNNFSVAPGFGWSSALIAHIYVHDLNISN